MSVAPAPVRRSGLVLLSQAGQVLDEARAADTAAERYRLAHLAALRAAAALLAERTQPTARRRPTNVWLLLSSLAPELGDWSAYFAAGASTRAAIEAGSVSSVTARDADDLERAVSQFVGIIESALGLLAAAS